MPVPLARIFAQQPLIATVKPIIVGYIAKDAQLEVVEALASTQDCYKDQILKLVVTCAEQAGKEVDPDVWEIYYTLKSPAALKRLKIEASEPSNIEFDLPLCQKVCTLENRSVLVHAGNTGFRTWESSLALTEYICCNYETFEPFKEVIELGAGTGLVSFALAKLLNVRSVYATDGSDLVVDKLINTARMNHLSEVVKPALLDWYNLAGADQLPKGCTIFAGDILYGITSSFAPILDLLEKLQPKRVFLCNPIRNAETYREFTDLCSKRNMRLRVLRTFKAEDGDESDYMFIVSVPPIPLELIELTIS